MEAIKTTTETSLTPDTPEFKGKVIKKSGKRIGYNYIILKSLKESQKNDVVRCLYIKSLTNFGICVIKEGSYGDSKDKQGRDIKDRLIWQRQLHETLQDKVRLPRLIGHFEENGNYYLVIERIKGKSLGKVILENRRTLRASLNAGDKPGIRFLGYLKQMVALLQSLHQQGIIHRDVTAANFMVMPNGKVAVIDMELSYSLNESFPAPPFQLGTYGYMSPEQEATHPPTVEQDIFSVGAILLQAWTGISPTKLTNGPLDDLEKRIHFFVTDSAVASVIFQCLQPDPALRPGLAAIYQVLDQYQQDLTRKRLRVTHKAPVFSRDQLLDTLQRAVYTLGSSLLTDPEKGWFAEDQKSSDNKDHKRLVKAWYASFSRGMTGPLYLLANAKMVGIDITLHQQSIQYTLDLIHKKYINRLDATTPGLYFGAAGIAGSLANALKAGLLPHEPLYIQWIQQLIQKENNRNDILYGIAGQGTAAFHCTPFIPDNILKAQHHGYTQQLLSSQHPNGCWSKARNDPKKRVTRGFARGVSGLTYFLLGCAEKYEDKETLAGAEKGLYWLMKDSKHTKKNIYWQSDSKNKLGGWLHEGGAGIALPFLRAWYITGTKQYYTYASGALRYHPEELIDNNLGIASGLSGLGEVYLEAFRLSGEQEWQDRATWLAQLLLQLRKEHPKHGPYWLLNHERQPIPEFTNGESGVLHFLLRYAFPEKMGLPLL